jgi:small subunit ribosomal protein S6
MTDIGYYETLYLTRPDLTDEELNKVQGRLKEAILNHEGEIFKSQKWADRNLAYRIGKYNKGTYHILVYKSRRSAVSEIERNLRFFSGDVLRFITVRKKEEVALRERAASEVSTQEGGVQ